MSDAVVLAFDTRLRRALRRLPRVDPDDVEGALTDARRVVVVGADADLASLLTRLMRAERLDVEVAYVPARRTPATRAYRLRSGRRAARRALRGSARRLPLIRDETGSVIVGSIIWRPADAGQPLRGEAVVDDAVLFDGAVAEARVEPTAKLPGLRARVPGSRRWLVGRAAQLGCVGVVVVRDGVVADRSARRSTVYRNTEGWLAVW